MKTILSKAAKGFVAAVTSPEAVKVERSLAVLVATRVLLAIGAGDALVRLVQQLAG